MKPERIIFVDEEFEKTFNELSEQDQLKKAIKRAIQDILLNVFFARQLKKKLIPKEILQKYNINNLWIYNLPSAWRLIYSITSSEEVKIIAAILDWMDHKDYERLFKFT